ncbi:MAG: hypothetical protein R2750_10385 [Bacteroidales bacterium]
MAAVILTFFIVLILPRLSTSKPGFIYHRFSATSMELILIFAFQVVYGYIYFMVGIFITVFMIGLAAGSLYFQKKIIIHPRNYSFIQYLIGIFCVLTPIILVSLKNSPPLSIVIHTVFIILILVFGIFTGIQFALGSKLSHKPITNTAAAAYGSDLLGSAMGALLVSAFLVPFFGLIKVCLIIGILNFIVGLLILVKKKYN